MQINEARSLLHAWETRMRPAQPPWKGDDYVKQEWVRRLELCTQDVARAAWKAWQNAGHRLWPNLYQLEDLIQRHGGIGDLNDCQHCNNTGWIASENFTQNGHEYTSCRPCNCDHGKMCERSPVWKDRPQLCKACKGVGYIAGHTPDDDVEQCFVCNGAQVAAPADNLRALRAEIGK